ncbi:MAG: DUF5667 domain-containing protein [Patescibacteria group bacterium]
MRLFFSVILLLFLSVPVVVFAQDSGTQAAGLVPSPINYPLAYPGILPDNPLYPLKMLRDRIVFFLINDPFKKAEFNLLQADKRLGAGLFLIDRDKNKASLAVDTISKGENYFHDAVAGAIIMQQQGRNVTSLVQDLDKAVNKHIEVVTNLRRTVPTQAGKLQQILERLKTYQQSIKKAKG